MFTDHGDGGLIGGGVRNLLEVLQRRAADSPHRRAFTFLDGDGQEEETATFEQLDRRARGIAATLQARGYQGRPVLLLYPPGLQYVAGLLGSMYAGCIAVPSYPPRPRQLARFAAILFDCEAAAALTSRAVLSVVNERYRDMADALPIEWVATDAEPPDQPPSFDPSQVQTESVAFLQYTSGSTGDPKGVMVTHANLLHNLAAIQRAMRCESDGTGMFWLPPYHDMGLIGAILEPIYCGGHSVLMSPAVFVQQPVRWLQAITRYRAVISGGPNFAYDLCIDKVSDDRLQGLDLGSWELAFNGSETARAGTMRRFAQKFACCGFHREAFYPCYGLAEATLLVSGGHHDLEVPRTASGAATDLDLAVAVSCGSSLPDQELIVVDPRNETACGPGVEGEIWVAGPSVTPGYWRKPAESEATFRAYVKDSGRGPFLRTGDLGVLVDGQLRVTGRIKDQINLGGRKFHPQDVELSVQRSHPSLRKGSGAAFSIIENERERLVVVQELDRRFDGDHGPIISAIREALAAEHDILAATVTLVTAGSVPKTSSGKVQRSACKRYLVDATGDLSVVATSESTTGEVIARILAQVLGVDQVGAHDNFFDLGGQSLLATRVASRVREELQVDLPLRVVFEQPTAASLAEAVERGRAGVREAPIGPAPRDGDLPLSFAQQRLWFLDQLEPNSPSYNVPAAVRLSGELDVAALRAALGEIVRRHEALRTTFAAVDGRPMQVIAPALELELPLTDLTDLHDAARQARAREEAAREARLPFDLERGPLVRAALLRLADREHVVLLTVHHIVSDGWSMGVLVRELAALYQAFIQGGPSPLPPLGIQYADFGCWQRTWLQGERVAEQLAYWKDALKGPLPVLELPTDRPRPPVQSSRGACHRFTLPGPLAEALRGFSRRQGATLFMTLLAAFDALLHRHTGQTDLCVGTPIANRNRAETEGLIGFFVNTLVLRTDLSGDPTFAELVGRVRETALGAYAHQDLPFERLVEELRPARDPSHTPLFQVVFALREAPLGQLRLPGLTLELVASDNATAKFDLTLDVVEADGQLDCAVEYNSDLFERSTVERLAGHLRQLLESAVADPGRRIGELGMLSAAERHQLLVSWNETAAAYPRERTVVDLFEEQASRRPGSVAVMFEEQQLTYRELNARANQLGRRLRELGVGPEGRVGLCVERSLEMIVGVLGILKAGAAYVPLDPDLPRERLGFMLDDAHVSVLVTQPHLLAQLPLGAAQAGPRIVCLDETHEVLAAYPADDPGRLSGPENLAYVIYTSGSTGRPKGVGVAHRAIVRLARENVYARLTADETILQAAPLAFDASTFEIWGSLLNGGRLALLPAQTVTPEAIGHAIRRHGVDTLFLTTALFHLIAKERPQELAGLRQLLTGGESTSPEHIEAFRRALPACKVAEVYGPTEATTFSSYYPVERDERGPAAMPIGWPIANTRLYVLDDRLQPVPVGVTGELYVGGDGLARGYLDRPALTAERFIPDPFGPETGARLYRTGDRVRYRTDGAVEFLGRLDHQVKLRGFRVELGEIEATLAQHEAIREVVVVAREEQAGDKRLVAYYVAAGEVAASELREFLRQRLPEYMVPSAFVPLAAMPLSPNGKVDRKALPAPEGCRAALGVEYVAARTSTEEVLAGIWAQLLGVEQVGIHDDFFDLGGHSLLATQLVSRARAALKVELPLRDLFEVRTVERLATRIDGLKAGGGLAAEPDAITRLPREANRVRPAAASRQGNGSAD